MRVVVDASTVHGWLPVGTFAIDRDQVVTWHTPFEPLVHHAARTDGDVRLPAPHDVLVDDDVLDATLVDDHRAAIVRAGTPPTLQLVELGSRRVELVLALRGSGPRLPGLADDEAWADDDVLAGDRRGIRVIAAGDRVLVTANESGHVVVVSLAAGRIERIYRVPAGSENTVFASRTRFGLLVGMKWNHRHSDLFHVSDDGVLLARWPHADDDDDVRWAMPSPAVVGDHVITYSDEGPYAGCLALLALPDLIEVAHDELPEPVIDLHANGDRFASVSGQCVTVGRIEGGEFAIEGSWTIHDLLAQAGVQPAPRTTAATADGRGSRQWFDHVLASVRVDGNCTVIAGSGGVVRAVEPHGERVLAEGRALVDARDGRVLFSHGYTLELVERARDRVVASVSRPDEARSACLVRGAFVYREDDARVADAMTVHATTDDGFTAELARGYRDAICPHLVSDGTSAWWVEVQYETAAHDRRQLHALARWRLGQPVERTPLRQPICSFAHVEATTYVLAHDGDDAAMHLFRLGRAGAFDRLTREPLPDFVSGLVVTRDRAFFLQPTSGFDAVEPAALWQVELATGEATKLATATIGGFSSLQIAGDELVWLESRDLSMIFFGQGTATDCAAICRLPLSR